MLYDFFKLSKCFVFPIFHSTTSRQIHHLNSLFTFVLSSFLLKKQLLNFSRKLLENCIFCMFGIRSTDEDTFFELLYLACPFYSSTHGNGHFVRLLALTNCSHCNPKVHNNKKIRLFLLLFYTSRKWQNSIYWLDPVGFFVFFSDSTPPFKLNNMKWWFNCKISSKIPFLFEVFILK